MMTNFMVLKLMFILFANVLTESKISILKRSSGDVILFGNSRL